MIQPFAEFKIKESIETIPLKSEMPAKPQMEVISDAIQELTFKRNLLQIQYASAWTGSWLAICSIVGAPLGIWGLFEIEKIKNQIDNLEVEIEFYTKFPRSSEKKKRECVRLHQELKLLQRKRTYAWVTPNHCGLNNNYQSIAHNRLSFLNQDMEVQIIIGNKLTENKLKIISKENQINSFSG